jgi:hypothetical protein
MKNYKKLSWVLIFIILWAGHASTQMLTNVEDLVWHSKFIFNGTVLQLNASTVPTIQDKTKTAVVKVDEVLEAPESLGDFTGKEITVLLKDPEKTKTGEQAIFFSNGWLYGKSMAVIEVGRMQWNEDTKRYRRQIEEEVRKKSYRALMLRLAEAELVIVGKVEETKKRDPEDQVMRETEHDPDWREAIIRIDNVDKGSFAQKTIAVLYPNSTDVMWYTSPKFMKAQEGIWLLRRKQTGEYTALHPLDFHPRDQRNRIRKLIEEIK